MSTDQQLKGDSLRRQLELSRKFAGENGLLLDDTLRDIGVSAWKGKNRKEGALARFLDMVEQGKVPRGSYLLIESLDRLSRDQVLEALSLFTEILSAGVIIVTLADGQTYSHEAVQKDFGKLIISLTIMARAHEESQRKSERVGAANAAKREKAWKGTGQITGNTPGWIHAEKLGRDQYRFSLNDNAKTVREIYEMAAKGIGAIGIVKQLNEAEAPTFRGKNGWQVSTVKKLLNGRDVLGIFQPHQKINGRRMPVGDAIEGYFPAAIDAELYLRAQKARSRPMQAGRKGRTFRNVFTGLCICAQCHGPMNLKTSPLKNGAGYYLVCNNHARGHKCTDGRKHFRYDWFEQAMFDHVHEFNLADVFERSQLNETQRALDGEVASLQLDADELDRKIARLTEALEETDQPISSVVSLLQKRTEERAQISKQLHRVVQLRAQADLQQLTADEAKDHLFELRRKLETATNDAEQYVLRSEIHAVVREFIQFIFFDSIEGTATAAIANGLLGYKFKDSKLIKRIDNSHMISDRPGAMHTEHFAQGNTHMRGLIDKLNRS